ncbi:MAG TPA: SDR family NAD(P)-dependent oxidoreductase, partial [Polyangiaceae bacterium]
NVSSMAGVTPLRGCAYYGAAKAGLAMASEIARLELAPRGVHVLTVYPGPVRSRLEQRARAQAPDTRLARWLPTGDADALAARVVDACERRRARVVYPGLYELANRFPAIARRVTSAASPQPLDAPA